jgi:hypothetical protein
MNISDNRGLCDFQKFLWCVILLLGLHLTASTQGTEISFNSIPKNGTALIYTHQDDDLIWMQPFWKITEKFIGGGMPVTPRFEEIIHNQQIYMDNHGYNIPYESNWYHPWGKIENEEYQYYYWGSHDPNYSYIGIDHLLATYVNSDTDRKEINKIKAKIEQYIASPDISRIITHNNWGEYGHFQHKQVNKAVRELAVKYRKDAWMLGCDNGNFDDIAVPTGITYTMGTFDTVLFDAIREIYLHPNNFWTWSTTRKPSGDHKFIKIVDAGNDKSNILTGETITVPGPYPYKTGAYIFDGVDDYMTLAGNNNTSFTIAMWVRPDEIKAMDISKMAEYPLSSKYDRSFYLQSDGRIAASINDGQSRTVTSAASLSAGTWAHILMTGNGNTLTIYMNGTREGSVSAGNAISNYASPEFVLGQAQVTSSFFKGQIADVRFYSYALNQSDIASIFGAPTPNYGIDYSSEKISKGIPSTDEYSYYADMSGAVSGNGHRINLVPGRDVYFRTKAADDRLPSCIQHLVVAERPDPPTVSIDYGNETTGQSVDPTIEYSASSSYTSPVSGTGNKITLIPGQDLYFWVKATSTSFYSLITHLSVPARPSPPEISIDYLSERTEQIIDPGIEYSDSSSYANPVNGTGNKMALTPGHDLYFWVKATSNSFYSLVTHLQVPVRPAKPSITIDYSKETSSPVYSSMEYATDSSMGSATLGGDTAIAVSPGSNLYFRSRATTVSFSSGIQHLFIPERPQSQAYTIDYRKATTVQAIPSTDMYSFIADMSDSLNGTDVPLDLMPGNDIFFRTQATDSSFCSAIQHLIVKQRPEIPVFTINFIHEQTNEPVDSTIEYAVDSSSFISCGTGWPIELNTGENIFFRKKATDSSFYSEIYPLIVKPRPETPKFTIDFAYEQTLESVDSIIEYSTQEDYLNPSSGKGLPIKVNPGENLYFRIKNTDSTFYSLTGLLETPQRPSLVYSGKDTIDTAIFAVKAILDGNISGFDLSDLEVINGHADNLQTDDWFDIIPENKGEIQVYIPPDSFDGASFASNKVIVYFKGLKSGFSEFAENELKIYPVPSCDGIVYVNLPMSGKTIIEILSPTGQMIYERIVNECVLETLELNDLKGIYYVKITSGNAQAIRKIILY